MTGQYSRPYCNATSDNCQVGSAYSFVAGSRAYATTGKTATITSYYGFLVGAATSTGTGTRKLSTIRGYYYTDNPLYTNQYSIITESGHVILNETGGDYDTRIEGDTATNLLVCDAGLDAVQIGTTIAGAIADFRGSGIVLNEEGEDRDLRVETADDDYMIFAEGSTNRVGISTSAPSCTLDVAGSCQFGGANTDLLTCLGRLIVRFVDDAGMDESNGSQGEIVFNSNDSKFYGCTVAGSPATWAALN